jgi:eukaryotic-like serine/threonine-protein kinase
MVRIKIMGNQAGRPRPCASARRPGRVSYSSQMTDVVGGPGAVDVRGHRKTMAAGGEPEIAIRQRANPRRRIEISDRCAKLLSVISIHRHSLRRRQWRRGRLCTNAAIATPRRVAGLPRRAAARPGTCAGCVATRHLISSGVASNRELDRTETLSGEDPEPTVLAGGPPVAGWDRYDVLELLGRGGMGAVYKARDRRLDRTVAIKFLTSADPNLALRLLREARAQARIEHGNICRVLDVGEVGGRAYIALQFVDGEPLQRAATHMALDEKVAVFRDVTLAIQEAHRLGIVHRDLKPANILVERGDAGWHPIVMDFGLARETSVDAGLTRSGALLGTPSYMSPEQARGDVRAIDRRSDIYSLGATLYELLAGRPPFEHDSLAQLLAQIIHDEPEAPRSLVPGLPVDLETIALQCLAKDPAQRYASARALADDLGRYLAGEPILGRRPSPWQRLRRGARRHRAVVAVAGVALVVVLAAGAIAGRSWLAARAEAARAASRTALAQRLGHEAKDIELFLRSAYQLPLQDTRPARDAVRARMRAIAATPHDLGPLGDAVVHDALGRGHLALHEWREAADELAIAAAGGLDTPELHAARGRALGELYHRAFEDARRSGDRSWLDGRRKQLEQQYLGPALAELAASRGAGDTAAYLEALIALYRGDVAAAEQAATAAADHAPWLFEARKLAADAAYAAAVAAFDRGDYDAACPLLDRAEQRYAQAAEVARSDASVHEAAAQAALQRAEIDFRQGRSPREPLDRALAAIDRALAADPDDAPGYTTKAYVLLRWYRTPSLRGSEDPRVLLERMAQSAERAVALDASDANAWDALGNAHVYRGNHESYHGGRGEPWWNRAIDEIEQALAIRPDDPWATNDLGVAHRWLGASLDQTGGDPMPHYEAALRAYTHASELDPQFLYAWSNQADLHASVAEHRASLALDPQLEADSAVRAGQRCLTIDSRYDFVFDAMSRARLSVASYLLDTGGDPTAALAGAAQYLDRADAQHPGNFATWFQRGVVAALDARGRMRDGGDPSASLAKGRLALHEATRLNPSSADVYVQAAELDLVEVAWASHDGRDVASAVARARHDADQAIALDPRFADAEVVAAEAYLQLSKLQPSRVVIAAGIAHADRALALNLRLARARRVRDALASVQQRAGDWSKR